ncbi:MAG: hypothetical protein QY316_01395 [Thermodesulfobacteriota bacterium]|nr:MAG: hypothetical protein QY316_01395 [Thermodesulfobacteriota bacterium]
MVGEIEIPKPANTGSTGTQVVKPEIVQALEESPLKGLPIAQTIEGLAATKSKNMGGEVTATLVAGVVNQLQFELQSKDAELKEARNELKQTHADLSASRIKAAVLQERINSFLKEKHLGNLIIVVGTGLISFGIDMSIDGIWYGYGLIFIGLLLATLGWFSNRFFKGEGA